MSHVIRSREVTFRSGALTRADLGLLALLFASFWVLTPFLFGASFGVAEIGFELGTIDTGNPVRWVVLSLLGAIAALALARTRLRGLKGGTALGWFTMTYVLLAAASPLWSADPAFTLRKVAGLLMFGVIAVALAQRWGLNRLTSAAIVLTTATVALALVAEVSQGAFRPWQGTYRFSGMMHPNGMGTVCSILALGGISYGRRSHKRGGGFYMLAAAAVVLLALTKSRGALAGCLAAASVLISVELRFRNLLLLLCGAVVLVLSTLILAPDIVNSLAGAAALGRPDGSELLTLTGRVTLWSELLGYVQQNPWLGFGYNTFWTSRHILEVADSQGWYAGNAHSGYMDVLLSLGGIGLGCFLVMLSLALARVWALHRRVGAPGTLFGLLVVSSLLTSMVSDVVMSDSSISSLIALVLLVRLGFGTASEACGWDVCSATGRMWLLHKRLNNGRSQ